MRALAILGARRFASLPNVPTFAEQGVTGEGRIGHHRLHGAGEDRKAVIATLLITLAKALASPGWPGRSRSWPTRYLPPIPSVRPES
ncbi:MAG: hypothetical protein IPO58_23785 [Betaproteobacteria bacterium]|nr:hypothetical protein [Betaproteobacteria bacterium]